MMSNSGDRISAQITVIASFLLGVVLPLLMLPATKSSPLVMGLAAVCALGAYLRQNGAWSLRRIALGWSAQTGPRLVIAFLLYMALAIIWAHNPAASADQFLQFILPVLFTLVLLWLFAPVAPENRTFAWIMAASAAGLLIFVDLKTGMKLRDAFGGRSFNYSYNRAIVTLVVLLWPLLALAVARRRWYLGLLLLPVFLAVAAGESETALLGTGIGVVVLPLAWFAPTIVRRIGLGMTLLVIAASPFIGTITRHFLGATLPSQLANAHADDRVNIWLSFEAAARQNWLFGNGFGSSLNLQQGGVARVIPPELVTLLGASHPHNVFLQVWVELGLIGAVLLAALTMFLFSAVGRMASLVQPFALACIAVAGIALVSHGAWQAWWIAAVGAAIVSFAALDHELRRTAAAITSAS